MTLTPRTLRMEVAPGQPDTIAISRRYTQSYYSDAGVVIFKNGLQAPDIAPPSVSSIAFGASASLLYGIEPFGFGGLRRMSVTDMGVSVLDSIQGLLTYNPDQIVYDNGLLYSNGGEVVDPETRTLVGTFFNVRFGELGLVRPDSAQGRLFFLTGSRLLVIDTRTLNGSQRLTFSNPCPHKAV